ncbi:MAG TPA: hypothetical protein IAC03_08020 [Candidatus Coprenecus pullistercoris]|nr:hypothetical protein [Candidatus Coprenecus pullistercoris]
MQRLGRLTLLDLRYGAGKVWPAGAVMAGLYIAYWVIMLLTGQAVTPGDRIPVLYIAAQFFAFCVPAAAYGYVNNPSDGIGYAMLPVRVWVKFTAMMLVSVIVIPLTFHIGIYVLDCLLTAVGGGRGFSGMVWSTESGISPGGFWYDFGKICLYQSVFVLGNLVLRKHKVALTVLAMLFLHGLGIGVLHIDETGGAIPAILYSYVLPVLIWSLSYQRLRRLQYR